LKEAVDVSFNMIDVDSDTSTNDMVVVLANGLAGGDEIDDGHPLAPVFASALTQVCTDLAKAIVADAEGKNVRIPSGDVERRRLPGRIEVRAVADGVDLGFLGATMPSIRDVAGRLNADFGLTGSWDRPELTGRIAVRDGAVTLPALGVRYDKLNGDLVLSGDTVRVTELTLRSGDGSADLTGFVRWEQLREPIFNLDITGRDFRTIDVRDFLTLTASGDLELRGTLTHPVLTGRATATSGTLYFADLIEKEVINLEDALFAEVVDTALLRRQGLGAEFESRFLDSLRIDSLVVEMGTDMWMRSSEANIQLSGIVTVNKVRDQYLLDGTLETPRGSYRLVMTPAITREFAVTRGQVRYFGTPDLDADLDIEAQHVVRTARQRPVTVFVRIGGTLYEPQLSLSSDIRPPISDTEIISYLLFGEPSVQALAGSQASRDRLVLQTVMGMLSGQLEYSLITDLGVPLDYLQIRPGEMGGRLAGTEIAIGKQFNLFGTTAFLTASPRICPQQNVIRDLGRNIGASLEFRLSREWLFATSVDPSRSCEVRAGSARDRYQFGLDLFWERSF
jgi:autotransporter translocation and assembly factor TamB